MFLFRPFGTKTDEAHTVPKRAAKSLAALYRILSEEFERAKPCECPCKMPMVYESAPGGGNEPNWRVETLWCGCRECRTACDAVVAMYSRLFDLKPPDPPEESIGTANAAP